MLRRLLFFLLILVSIKLLFVFFTNKLLPDPRRDIDSKLMLMHAFHPNTVFIGTSRTLFGIQPTYFDSLLNQSTRSFNLGLLSLSPASSLMIAEGILKQDSEIDNILIELSALDFNTTLLRPNNAWKELCFRIGLYSDVPNYNLKQKLTFFMNALNLAVFRTISITGEIVKIKKYLSPTSDPIEGVSKIEKAGNQKVENINSSNTIILDKNKQSTLGLLHQIKPEVKNTFMVNRINLLIAEAERKGRNLIFYIPNNISENERLILKSVIGYIPSDNIVIPPLALYKDSFFDPINLFDDHHLNTKGARMYTQMLSTKLYSRIRKP